tara:strand:+ start:514 stop:645 length:132 start_codon:yes stop_codon:yes gene_type:complete
MKTKKFITHKDSSKNKGLIKTSARVYKDIDVKKQRRYSLIKDI